MKTTTKVKKWGNSLAIRVPKSIVLDLGLENDSKLDIISDGKTAIIKPSTNKSLTLDELLEDVTPENVHGEFDWGSSVGKEVW